jgi:hypothetical protein
MLVRVLSNRNTTFRKIPNYISAALILDRKHGGKELIFTSNFHAKIFD